MEALMLAYRKGINDERNRFAKELVDHLWVKYAIKETEAIESLETLGLTRQEYTKPDHIELCTICAKPVGQEHRETWAKHGQKVHEPCLDELTKYEDEWRD